MASLPCTVLASLRYTCRFATPHAAVCVRLIDNSYIELAGGFVWRRWQVRGQEARQRERDRETETERGGGGRERDSVCV